MVKVAGTISKSGEVMKSMNDLMQVGKLQAGMKDLAKEMTKAGLIEEMVDDVMDDVGACARPGCFIHVLVIIRATLLKFTTPAACLGALSKYRYATSTCLLQKHLRLQRAKANLRT